MPKYQHSQRSPIWCYNGGWDEQKSREKKISHSVQFVFHSVAAALTWQMVVVLGSTHRERVIHQHVHVFALNARTEFKRIKEKSFIRTKFPLQKDHIEIGMLRSNSFRTHPPFLSRTHTHTHIGSVSVCLSSSLCCFPAHSLLQTYTYECSHSLYYTEYIAQLSW